MPVTPLGDIRIRPVYLNPLSGLKTIQYTQYTVYSIGKKIVYTLKKFLLGNIS